MNESKLYRSAKKYHSQGLHDEAYRYYLEAAMTEDDGYAMYELADMYYQGDYVSEDYDKAGNYYGMAYDRGITIEPEELIIAGCNWDRKAKTDDRHLERAMRYYQAAANRGIGYGHECLGEIYFNRGEYDKAYEHLLKMEGRNPLGFYYMGRLYDEGLAVEKNMDKAVYNYRKAVETGKDAIDHLGIEDEHSALARQRLEELMHCNNENKTV